MEVNSVQDLSRMQDLKIKSIIKTEVIRWWDQEGEFQNQPTEVPSKEGHRKGCPKTFSLVESLL